MSNSLPLVTVVVPTRPGQKDILAVTAARKLDYPADRIEIVIARGRQPAVQRNAAVREAKGEWIYFLDDDAVPAPGNLRRVMDRCLNSPIKMLGGPSLCPADAPPIEQVFSVVLSSWLAFGPSRARYESVGVPRESGEKELILCNLIAERAAILAVGGFDEALYPNEENALMDAVRKRGAVLFYDPAFIAYRRPRPNLRAYAKMAFTYGRGRAEQFRLHPTPGSVLNFVPPLFCLFLLALPFAGMTGLAVLSVYFLAIFIQAFVSSCQYGVVRGFLSMPLVTLTHVAYGLGFWRGLLTTLKRPTDSIRTEVQLEHF